MPSEQENQSPSTQPLQKNISGRPPLAGDIGKRLQDGDSILDFVKKNTPGYSSAAQQIQEDVDAMGRERQEPVITAPEPAQDYVPDLSGEPVTEPEQSEEEQSEEDLVDDEELELKGTAAENFKNLRVKLKEVKEESEKKDKLLSEVTKELESYAKGEKIPEELAKREARIAELENYERILNLRKSKYYQDNFVKPLDNVRIRLEKIAKEYNINPDTLKQAANLKSEAELNRYLSNNFDTVGATDVKNIINTYKNIQSKAAEAEKEPEEALHRMIEGANAARAEENVRRLKTMQETTRSAWVDSLNYIKEEGKIRELMYQEGDVDHNNKVVKPIVEAAASEYGKLVKELVANGLEELPKPLASALSRLCQLAHASAVAIDSRERAISMAEELQTNTQRTNRYARPSVSGKVGSGKTSQNGTGGPSSPMEAAESILRQIRGR